MPKIDAPTVREHHAMVKAKLIAATEEILREKGTEGLSAGAVAERAGIARNSIYRYVDSVEDLKFLALEQHVPRWSDAIFSDLDDDLNPEDKMAAFAVACLKQTTEFSHGFLAGLMHKSPRQHGSPERSRAEGEVKSIHGQVDGFIREQWHALGVKNVDVWTGYVRAIIFDSFGQAEAGASIEDLSPVLSDSIHALVQAATGGTYN